MACIKVGTSQGRRRGKRLLLIYAQSFPAQWKIGQDDERAKFTLTPPFEGDTGHPEKANS
jgi:hypothetical protein